jgi:hypothetical protein
MALQKYGETVELQSELEKTMSDNLPGSASHKTRVNLANEIDAEIDANIETVKNLANLNSKNMADRDEQVASWAEIKKKIEEINDDSDFKTFQRKHQNFTTLMDELHAKDFNSTNTEIQNWKNKVQDGVNYVTANMAEGLEPVVEAEATIKNSENLLPELTENLEAIKSMNILELNLPEYALETQNEIDEMHDLINKIQEEIERARSLVKELSRKNFINFKDDFTVYDATNIPKTVDFSAETNLELSFKPAAMQSHLALLMDTASDDYLSVKIVDKKLEFTFEIGGLESNPVTVSSDLKLEKGKWYFATAKRTGNLGTLIIRESNENGKVLELVQSDPILTVGATSSRMRRETAKLYLGSELKGTPSEVSILNVRLNDRPIYIWNFVQKSENFDKSASEINIDTQPEFPKPVDQDECYQFSGEDSWVYFNESTHKTSLLVQSGTIMVVIKLKAPVYADGLIFFLGDPTQHKFFLAFEMANGRPRFLYNLDYANGPMVVELKPSESKYIPTDSQEELNFRVGMVGGVAGLAVQEWRSNKVVSVENDYWLKEKGQNCPACEFKLTNEMHFGGIKALGRDLSHFEEVKGNKLSTWNKPYNGCMKHVRINHVNLNLEGLSKSNVMPGCRMPKIDKISVNGVELIQREVRLSLTDFIATFSVSVMAGYLEQDAVILRVKGVKGDNYIEFGMKKINSTPSFYYDEYSSNAQAPFDIKADIKAETGIQVTIVRKDLEVIISINNQEPVKITVEKMDLVVEDMTLQIGAKYQGRNIKNGFRGCITNPYIRGLKDMENKPLYSAFDGFKCQEKAGNEKYTGMVCVGEVRFNECIQNHPQMLIERPSSNEILTVEMNRDNDRSSSRSSSSSRRHRNKHRNRKCPKMTPIDQLETNKNQMTKSSMIKLNQKNLAALLISPSGVKFEIRIDYKEDGSLLQIISDDCSASISLLIIQAKVQLVVKIDGGHAQFEVDREIPTDENTDISLEIKPDLKFPERTRFSISVHGTTETKRLRKNLNDNNLRSIYVGQSPTNLKCTDLNHPYSYSGSFYGVFMNGEELKKRRYENSPVILAGSKIPGIFLGKRETTVGITLEEDLEEISFTLRTLMPAGEILTANNKQKGEFHFQIIFLVITHCINYSM